MDTTLTNEELAEIVVDYICDNGGITYVQIEELLKQHIDIEGDREFGAFNVNMVFWNGMSEQFAQIMKMVHNHPKIDWNPTSPITYFVDGKVLTLPVVKSARKYKSEHWLPIAYYKRKEANQSNAKVKRGKK